MKRMKRTTPPLPALPSDQPPSRGWLMLDRRRGQHIGIRLPDGRALWIRVERLGSERVRLAIHAPLEIVVHREEIWAAIRGEQPSPGQEAGPAGTTLPFITQEVQP